MIQVHPIQSLVWKECPETTAKQYIEQTKTKKNRQKRPVTQQKITVYETYNDTTKHYSTGGGGGGGGERGVPPPPPQKNKKTKKPRLRSITIAWLKMKTQIIIIILLFIFKEFNRPFSQFFCLFVCWSFCLFCFLFFVIDKRNEFKHKKLKQTKRQKKNTIFQ